MHTSRDFKMHHCFLRHTAVVYNILHNQGKRSVMFHLVHIAQNFNPCKNTNMNMHADIYAES